MKKILLIAMVTLLGFTMTGCGKEKVELDLKKLDETLSTLTSNKFYIFGVTQQLENEEKPFFKDMEDVYDTDFEKVFGFKGDNVTRYVVRKSTKTNDMYFVFLPADGKEETIKKAMKSYFEKEKITTYKEDKHQGHLIYVVSEKATEVITEIKKINTPVFSAMVEVTKENMEQKLGIKADSVSEFLMREPMMIVNSNSYIIIKPAEGKKEEVTKAMDAYMKKLEEQWKTYLVDQYELVTNRTEEEYGEYLIYIISEENKLVLETIKNNKIN